MATHTPAPFKNWFNADLYRKVAELVAAEAPGFDRARFLQLTLTGLEDRELMERMRQTAIALEAALPGTYQEKLAVLRALAPRVGQGFVALACSEFVARYGLAEAATSLEALRFFTRFGSAEFAVRPFLQRDLAGTLAVLQTWARDPDEHVRRLASEGSRPRLPWGLRLTELVRDPRPTEPLLTLLKDDPALYVRKSVANHLNDIAKDHPEWMLDLVSNWDRTKPGTAWVVRHALRTLVKRGHPRALALCGARVAAAAQVRVVHFTASPRRIKLGGRLQLTVELVSTAPATETLIVDYVIHYVKANGSASPKVFKWSQPELLPGATLTLTKRQTIRDFTTRRHHPGRHRVELQINGQRLAETAFVLTRPQP